MESNINSVKKQYTFNDITNCIVSFFPPFKSANDLAYKIKNIFRTYKEFEKSIKDNEFYFKRKFSPKTEY
ncbi:MAG: hypothetical protein P1U46_02105 [Patescibacteria group bacterium]|nr:hypothetical protein [Patescibacteria group bacterium]